MLPTGGAARVRGGLSAADFVRTFMVQTLTRRGLETIAPSALALAGAEGLAMHARSVAARLGKNRREAFSAKKASRRFFGDEGPK